VKKEPIEKVPFFFYSSIALDQWLFGRTAFFSEIGEIIFSDGNGKLKKMNYCSDFNSNLLRKFVVLLILRFAQNRKNNI
jgi:hypothetical protein